MRHLLAAATARLGSASPSGCSAAQRTARDDVLVAGAAADLAGDRLADLGLADGSGLRSSSQRAVIIIPGVQKPHCRPCPCMKPCCTGSSSPPLSRSSTVRTVRPSAMAASTVQLFTGSPSIHTTQVPQLDVSQPQWVPVRPRWSRTKWTSSSRGSTSPGHLLAVDGHRHLHGQPSSSGPGHGAAQRPQRQLAAPGGACSRPDPAGRRTGCSRSAAAAGGGRQVLLGGGPAPQRVLGLGGAEVRGAHGGQPDADVGDGVAVELTKAPAAATAQSPARRSTFS